jgi:hypothetical protein
MKYPEIFEYVFFRVYLFYCRYKDSIPKFSSVIVLSLIQGANILTLLFLFLPINKSNLGIFNVSVSVFSLLLILLNHLYFNKNKFDQIIEKWKDEEGRNKIRKGILVTVYVISSIILFFGVAGYIGYLHNRK